MTEAMLSDTRCVEYQVSCEQIAFRLHRQVDAGEYADVDASFYRSLANEPHLARLSEATQTALLRAAARAQVADARLAIREIAERDAFFALDEQTQRLVLQTIAALPDDAGVLRDYAQLVDAGLAALDEALQRYVVSELDRARMNSAARRTMTVLVASAGFMALQPGDQRALVAYVAGPRVLSSVTGSRRAAMIGAAWRPRVEALDALVRRHHGAGADAAEFAHHLRAFLYARRLPLCLLLARGLHHHDIVLFGEMSDAHALSYGLRCTPNELSARSFVFSSPDPFVANEWQFPPRARTETYHYARYTISAYQEAALLAWLENNFPVRSATDGATARFSRPACFRDGDFCRMVERFVASITRSEVKPTQAGFVREGRPTTGPMSATQRLRAFFSRKQAA